jgi:hypothetical protein
MLEARRVRIPPPRPLNSSSPVPQGAGLFAFWSLIQTHPAHSKALLNQRLGGALASSVWASLPRALAARLALDAAFFVRPMRQLLGVHATEIDLDDRQSCRMNIPAHPSKMLGASA